jgi:hypothetical protein
MKSLDELDQEKTPKEKTYTYKEVYNAIEFVYKKNKKTKYISLFLTGLWTPAITLLCWVQYEHPAVFITGAFISTFTVYVFDETYELGHSYMAGKMKKNDKND